MSNRGCGHATGAGPFAQGRELVEFVAAAHGGEIRTKQIPGGGLATLRQGCHPRDLRGRLSGMRGDSCRLPPTQQRPGQHPVCR